MKSRILVVEDDSDINNLVSMNLRDSTYEVDSCDRGDLGLQMAMKGDYQLIILDISLPGMDGLEICRTLRSEKNLTPILMLTAKDSEADRVVGLEMGADDYITKPFSIRELQARVKAMFRRVDMLTKSTKQEKSSLTFRTLSIEIDKRLVTVEGNVVELTSTEFDLLLFMARQPGLVFSRSQLLDSVWGYKHSGYEHTVNSHINRLRTKLEKNPSNPEFVLTVWGVGYKFANG